MIQRSEATQKVVCPLCREAENMSMEVVVANGRVLEFVPCQDLQVMFAFECLTVTVNFP